MTENTAQAALPAAPPIPTASSHLTRALDWVSGLVGAFCGLATLGMVLIISYEVVCRYLFNSPTTWVTEYSLYIFVGTSFLTTAYAHLMDSHIRVEILLNNLSSPVRHKFLQASAWAGLMFVVVAAWQMVLFVGSEYEGGARAWGLMATPLWIPETPVAIGLALFALAVLSEARKLSLNIDSRRELTGLIVFAAMVTALLFMGLKPPSMAGSSLDWGTASVVVAVLAVAWLWNGFRVAAGVAAMALGGGLLFAWAADFSTLGQGAVMAFYLLSLMALGVRIAFSLGMVGALGVLFLLPTPQLQVIAERAWTSVNSFAFTAVPMFILMGAFLLRSGVTSDLFGVMLKWLGRFPGGIAHATVGACGIFAAVSGSSLATAATMGMTACPEMTERGYSPRLTYGVVAAGGTLGILIPPSIAMIVYGSLVGEPISALFIAGILPGAFLMLSFMLVVFAWSYLWPSAAPRGAHYTWGQKFRSLTGVLPFVLLIVGVLGSLYMGVATPTEAGALGALIAAGLCFLKKKMTFKLLMDSVMETAKVTSFLIFIVAAASVMGYAFDYIRLPKVLVEVIQGADFTPGLVILTLVIIYMVLGMFIDPVSMMLMTLSVSFPIVTALGFHPIWFGVVLVMMIEIGLITPPVGVILFILKGMSGDTSLKEIVMGVLPFVGVFLANIALFYFFPALVMWLPNQMSGAQ
ncbi:MAG: TRAP transporter large permease subunit [Desulfarculaceae bacterium]|nr:TRAP transporter large permease subunit [Desulfarculaceae bacterium]MCF8047861.1 TRAP transporter large permease subunit [Desulfarculaceae bacterium]MCF8065410.1 TRAP transporter large permease subunit [Desulfarculaceae bacterium]MCF8096745.1 TRAP transporter large permease subunit [Desulfarculaceae bacterium]MCF8123319.1 TRAP transporter large permease subunit [Desulfarculaceae bacterium]